MVCPLERADIVSLATDSFGAIVMFNYPVLECLVAFAIIFSIGFLLAKNDRRGEAVTPKDKVARI